MHFFLNYLKNLVHTVAIMKIQSKKITTNSVQPMFAKEMIKIKKRKKGLLDRCYIKIITI